jgi:DNA-binding PadR family transcriptional regulator
VSKKDTLYICTTQQQEKNDEMIHNYQKEVQTKLTKGLLDMIVLQYLEQESMHGYQLITKIRKGFGVYFGPSTVYPLLGLLEKKGYVTSAWNMNTERPRKVYKLTNDGKNVLNFTESSLNLICKNMATDNKIRIQAAPLISTRSTLQRENPPLTVC